MTGRLRWGALLGATLVVVGALGGAPVTAGSTDATSAGSVDVASDGDEDEDDDNEAPLADAGLDQQVPVNATVHLDASGSRDPDGSIESYEWSIERPDGNNVEPACPDCARTEFPVATNGTYDVTVRVTDDDGKTSSDTLYVRADEVEGPDVELTGPTDIGANLRTNFTATAQAGDSPLMRIEWKVNGSEAADREVAGRSATDDLGTEFDPGTHSLTVRVVSDRGRTDTATLTIDADQPSRPCSEATWNATLDAWDTGPCSDDGSGSIGLGSAGSNTGDTACRANQNDDNENYGPDDPDYYCDNDMVVSGESKVIVQDADQDGSIQWGSKTMAREEIQEWANGLDGVSAETGSVGVTFDSMDAYRDAMGTSYLNPSEDPTWYPSQINKTDSFTEDQYMGKKDKDNDRYNGIENFYSKSPNQNSNKNMYKINSDGKNIVEDNKKNKNTKTSQNKDNNSDKNDGSKDETSWYQI